MKSKIVAGLLAFIFPGLGHFYLGLMQKGLMMMALIILDICAIVYFAVEEQTVVLLIVLFSLFIPVIFFYNIFDALQSTDFVNGYRTFSEDPLFTDIDFPENGDQHRNHPSANNYLGWLLIVAGGIFFFASKKPEWLERVFDYIGSFTGAGLLIGAGLFLFIKESRNNR